MSDTMTREQFYDLAESDGYERDDPAAMVTMASYIVGPNIKRIASFLGRPRSWCQEAAHNLRDGGVWRGDKIVVEDELDGIQIALHSAVAAGWLEMVDAEENPHE